MKFECPHCKQRVSADESVAGTEVNCPSCERSFSVPNPQQADRGHRSSYIKQFRSTYPDLIDRVKAIDAAWIGYLRESYLAAVCLIVCGCGLVFAPLFLPDDLELGGAERLAISVLGAILIAIGVTMAIHANKRNALLAKLQAEGTRFLSAGYQEYRAEGLAAIHGFVSQSLGIEHPDWECYVHLNHANSVHPALSSLGFKGPSFHEPMSVGVVSYFGTQGSLMVVPKTEAELKPQAGSLWQDLVSTAKKVGQVISNSEPTANIYAAMRKAAQSAQGVPPQLNNVSPISIAELYFQDMVTTNYSVCEGQIGRITISTRDGGSFSLRSTSEAANKVRDAIRARKA